MTDKLKPCPFCGSGANYGTKIVEHRSHGEVVRVEVKHNVQCCVCLAATRYYSAKGTAKKRWNGRVDNA